MENQGTQASRSLRNLYFVRTVVQLAWAGLVFASVSQPTLTAVLLVAYPLWDVACTLYDLKTSASTQGSSQGSRTSQYVNIAAGLLTALAVALNATTHPAYAIAAFGAWALAAGVLQLVIGLLRRKKLGGQWAMILSGAQSSAAGVSFILGGLANKLHASNLAGYAIFGAVYFCIAGVLLARKVTRIAQ